MTSIPWLTIHFLQSDGGEGIRLELTHSHGVQSVAYSLALPFSLSQVPLVLRALDARQYPDYPSKERFFRLNDIREQTILQLQNLNLWEGNGKEGRIVADVHKRVGRLLGASLLPNAAAMGYLSRVTEIT